MIHRGGEAIAYLADAVASGEDPGASSHWQRFHSTFRFQGNGFEGLQGFGGSGRPYRGVRRVTHRLLQRPYRRMGAKFDDFPMIDGLGEQMADRQGRAYDLDVLRQVLTLSFTKHMSRDSFSPQATLCVIGDGFASLTVLLLASGSAGRVVLVNLTKTQLVDLWYLRLWMGADEFEGAVNLVTDAEGLHQVLAAGEDSNGRRSVVAIQAEHHALLRHCPIGMAFNVVSMQEMDPPVIAGYFDDLRAIAGKRPTLFYCCNREEKMLPDGTVTRFANYPWRPGDQILIDELCPWHQHYYAAQPPFYRPYDGPIRHRLVRLSV